jgi:uncharacterized protein YggE
MKHSPLLKSSALLSLVLCAAPARAQQQAQPPLITVTAQAELRVPPDEVVFNLEVSKLDKEITVAQRQTDESVRQILALARRYNVPAEDVKTDYISVDMRYSTDYVDDDEDSSAAKPKRVKREFLGYSVSKTVNVRFTDLKNYEQFFSEVLKAGVSKVEGVEFRTSQIRKYKDQARTAAIRAAREKAVALTAEIGQTVGKAYSIQEEGYERPGSMANNTTVISGQFSGDETTAFAPGTISVTARVTVSFILN